MYFTYDYNFLDHCRKSCHKLQFKHTSYRTLYHTTTWRYNRDNRTTHCYTTRFSITTASFIKLNSPRTLSHPAVKKKIASHYKKVRNFSIFTPLCQYASRPLAQCTGFQIYCMYLQNRHIPQILSKFHSRIHELPSKNTPVCPQKGKCRIVPKRHLLGWKCTSPSLLNLKSLCLAVCGNMYNTTVPSFSLSPTSIRCTHSKRYFRRNGQGTASPLYPLTDMEIILYTLSVIHND